MANVDYFSENTWELSWSTILHILCIYWTKWRWQHSLGLITWNLRDQQEWAIWMSTCLNVKSQWKTPVRNTVAT